MTLLYRPERVGGIFGDGGVTMPGIMGRVRNLSLSNGPLGSFVVSFLWEHDSGDTTGAGYLFFLVIDGDVTGLLRPGVVYTTEPFPDGKHDIRVIPVPSSQGVPLGLSVDLLGDRAIVTWAPGTEGDLVGYEVFWDAGTGTVNTTTRKALVTATNVPNDYSDIVPTINVGGTGKIRVSGKYSGPQRNGFCSVEIANSVAGAGEFLPAGQKDWRLKYRGDTLATGRLYGNMEITPLEGLRVSFISDASTYMAGNTYFFFLGPRTFWVSESLDPGTYKFAVRGVDADGDVGTLSAEVSVAIVATPAQVDVSARYTPATRVVSLDWIDNASGDDLLVYTNYDFAVDRLTPYVLEEGPAATFAVAAEAGNLTAINAAEVGGRMLLYARAFDGTIEEDNATLLAVDLTAADVATGLSDVVIESAFATAGPRIAATIAIDAEGILPTALRLITNTTDTTTGAATHSVALPPFTLATGNVLRGTVQTQLLDDDDYYLWIQAQNVGGNWTDVGQSIGPITILDSAPAQVTGIKGASY